MRQVLTGDLDDFTGAIGRAVSVTGTMTFDGKGGYSFNGQMMDTKAGSAAKPYSTSGTYSVAGNNLAQIQNPIDSLDIEIGAVAGVGPKSIIASSTEGNYRDLFVAVQAGSSASNSTVNGSYQLGFIDFLQGNASNVRDGYATLTSTGNGTFGNVTVDGAMANQTNSDVQQAFAGVNYSVGSNGSGTLTFPAASGTAALSALVSGKKTLYVSADGNLLVAGDPSGFDLLVAIKASSGAVSNDSFQGTYFVGALQNDGSSASFGQNTISTYYGSTLGFGAQGAGVSHWHLAYFDEPPFDFTTNIVFNFASDGTYNDGTFEYLLGTNGKAQLQVGRGSFYSLILSLAAPASTSSGSGPVIDATKIFNAGSYAPVTYPVAPGEAVTLFGTNLASAPQSGSVPLPRSLGGVSISVNGRAAPISFVSPTQVNFLIPFALTQSYATIQLTSNGVAANPVTLYANFSAPGVYTLTSNDGTFAPGIGPAAVLHTDYSLVTADHPAIPGETLQLYVTGLGPVTPNVSDGFAAPSDPPAMVLGDVFIDIIDTNFIDSPADVTFAGLAPGFAGLYQVNFVVPPAAAPGLAFINVSTDTAVTSEALLYVR
ncbi:MAG TPA: hypothetical protein VFW44_14825 [Bryobacteraceae bacterium]|nr:hypothetical protein [Bryobacteraceae bacterium]